MGLDIVTFGFNYRNPPKADLVLDCRHQMPNPFWILELRPFCGENEKTKSFLDHHSDAISYFEIAKDRVGKLLQEKENVKVAVGCTGGFHRSVYIARKLYDYFSSSVPSTLTHLDIEKKGKKQ